MSIYKSIKGIYDSLQDDRSKEIFIHRIMFSMTNKDKYMDAVVQELPERQMLECVSQEAYIFGCGFYGKLVHKYVNKTWLGFVDNKIKGMYCGLRVITPQELPKEAYVYVSVKYYAEEIEKQLLDLGIRKENIVNVGRILMELGNRQYFDLPALNHVVDETFVDAGCLNGISSNNFIQWAANNYKHIYCFEADPENVIKCKENMQKLLSEGKITIYDKALSNHNGKISFVSMANGTSYIGEGDKSIEAVSLDSFLSNKKVTFIKMDIEGAEYDALLGAEKIISEQRPKLAISVYHRPSDIYDIPELILSYCPDYKLYLRHYSLFCEETILYAI